jgi:hypothetical protein
VWQARFLKKHRGKNIYRFMICVEIFSKTAFWQAGAIDMNKKSIIFIRIGTLLFKSIIIVVEFLFLIVSLCLIIIYLNAPETFKFGTEFGWAWQNGNTFLIFYSGGIVFSLFAIIITLKLKKIIYYPLLLLLPMVNFYYLHYS